VPTVVVTDVENLRPLRWAVLRPGRPLEETVYLEDHLASTLHLAALGDDGTVVGCATFFPEPYPVDPDRPAWRLRGMATAEAVRGQGVGVAVLTAGLAAAAAAGIEVVWCHGRTSALGFYQRMGFVAEGEEFRTAHGIPHLRMWRRVHRGDI
jgi:predicted GNAT family N-acyltransferase